jgi:predicted nucleotidyltransferase
MRLTAIQRDAIRNAILDEIGDDVRILVFGSRTDDRRRGGDIDLLIESDLAPPILQQARIKSLLEQSLSIPVDLVFLRRGSAPTAFQRIALSTAIPLEGLQ